MEEWRDIPGYEGLYQVSDLGRVKSLGNDKSRKEKILRSSKNGKYGYLQVALCKDGVRKICYVSLLVWEAFNGPVPEGYEVNHNDEVKTNNKLENLSLMSHKANCGWGSRNRRISKSKSKMVEQHTLDGTHICTWFNTIGVERELGYEQGNISKCCNGRRKTAYGYIWKYAE